MKVKTILQLEYVADVNVGCDPATGFVKPTSSLDKMDGFCY